MYHLEIGQFFGFLKRTALNWTSMTQARDWRRASLEQNLKAGRPRWPLWECSSVALCLAALPGDSAWAG